MATAITFDDGYADNATLALPILQKLGLTATFFIATGFLDGGRMWNDTVIEAVRAHRLDELDLERIGFGRATTESPASKRASIGALLRAIKHLDPAERDDRVAAIAEAVGARLPDDLMMTRSMVRALHGAGMSLGGHTVRHPILRCVSDAEAEREIAQGRDALREISGEPVRLFAYPNGVPDADYQSRHVALVKRLGFDAAVCTASGAAVRGSDRYQLPRFRPWDRTAPRYALRFARNLMYTRSALAV
jgi:peptidoglycan/xylan/chitin deacetylase (PgdA/CDA1 family)